MWKYSQWLDIWLENYVKPTSKIKTYTIYKQIVEKRLKPRLGEYELNEISPVILQCYVTELLRQGNAITGSGLSANTVNGIITVIQNSLKIACMIGESEKYIADKIKRPKTSEKEVNCFTVAEQKKIAGLKGDNQDQDVGIKVALTAMEAPLRQIVTNAGQEASVIANEVRNGSDNYGYNAGTEQYGDMIEMGILDPTKVTRSALQYAASIAGLMLTTECMIADAPRKDDAAPAAPMGGMGGMPGMM